MEDAIFEEYPFSFLNGQESLQSRVSTVLAFDLWQHKYFSHPASQRCDPEFLNVNFSCTEILAESIIPSRLKEMVDVRIEQIRGSLENWIYFLRKAGLFDQNFPDVLPKCFPSIVFNSNGTICWRQTASNLVEMAQFSDLEKYKIACTYCLENDVRQIWPSVSQDSGVNGNYSDQFDLINYWNMRMKSEADSVTVGNRFQQSFERGNCAAFEYFFDMLTGDDLLPEMSVFYSGCSYVWRLTKFECIRHILCKFNKDQTRMLFQTRPGRLFATLMAKDEYFSHSCELWSAMKQYVLESADVFHNIVHELWKAIFLYGKLDFMRRDQINQFLIEVWISAPDHVKSRVSDMGILWFITYCDLSSLTFSQYYGHDLTFLLQLLNSTHYVNRNSFWRYEWYVLIRISKPLYLKEIIKLCLSNEEAIKFKQEILAKPALEFHFKELIKLALYSDFNDYLHILSEDPKHIQHHSKRFLESNMDILLSYDDDRFCKFDAFVSSMFSNVVEDEDVYKEQIISSKNGLSHLHRAFNKHSLEDFNRIVSKFIKSDQSLGNIKRKLLDYCRDYVPSDKPSSFDLSKWVMLLKWCTADTLEITTTCITYLLKWVFDKTEVLVKNYFSSCIPS